MERNELKNIVECMLFLSDKPVSVDKLAKVMEIEDSGLVLEAILVNDMENHPVVSRVPVVTVRPPAAGFNVNLDVALKPLAPGDDHGIFKIGPSVVVAPPRVYNSNGLILFGLQVRTFL